jgi:hypothetical protein
MAKAKAEKNESKDKSNVVPESEAMGSYEGFYGVPSRSFRGNPPNTDYFLSYARYRFGNLWNGIMPFQQQEGFINIRDAIWLCQKAYFNVAVFRNSINTLAELSNTEIYLQGGNQQSQDFFNAWFKRINLWKLKEQFFRELFRSGNVFLIRLEGPVSKTDALKMNQTYAAAQDLQLPVRYVLLNIADIAALNTINYDTPTYFKVLTPQQVQLLRKSKNSDDQAIYKSLPEAIKGYFDGAAIGTPVPLDLSKLHTIFYQKQDYEPFAIPMGFAVLDDINLKLELKKTDAILARTVENIILLVTTGTEQKADGTGGVSQKSISALRELFRTEQIGRVLVADFSTKVSWAIPDLNKVLGPQKYQVVNQDIAQGLMDIFFGEERFANVAAKLKVFIEKINRVQEIFINDFLQAEIKRISELMNFKSYPEAKFVRVDIDDPTQMMRIIAQLIQLGVLTAKDGLEALNTGEFPDFDKLVENQKNYKELKDEGLFAPVIMTYPPERVAEAQAQFPKPIQNQGGGKPVQPTGRPPGTKSPQTTKKISPIGTGSEKSISMTKLIDTMHLMDKVREEFTIAYKKENKIKRLTENQKELISNITKTLFENEEINDWENKVQIYAKEVIPPNIDKALDIEGLKTDYDLSADAAILLYHSRL